MSIIFITVEKAYPSLTVSLHYRRKGLFYLVIQVNLTRREQKGKRTEKHFNNVEKETRKKKKETTTPKKTAETFEVLLLKQSHFFFFLKVTF